ncbi:hypothetical protein OROHE_013697 [Orobanche hederae]
MNSRYSQVHSKFISDVWNSFVTGCFFSEFYVISFSVLAILMGLIVVMLGLFTWNNMKVLDLIDVKAHVIDVEAGEPKNGKNERTNLLPDVKAGERSSCNNDREKIAKYCREIAEKSKEIAEKAGEIADL